MGLRHKRIPSSSENRLKDSKERLGGPNMVTTGGQGREGAGGGIIQTLKDMYKYKS